MFAFPIGFFNPTTGQGDPYWDNVVLYLPMTGANGSTVFTDVSKYGHTVTANGNYQVSSSDWPALAGVNSSGFSDGVGDYISVPGNSAFNCSDSSFTLEFFIKRVGVSQQYGRLFQTRNGDLNPGIGLFIDNVGATQDTVYLLCSSNGTTSDIKSGPVATLASGWNYLALTRTGSNFAVQLNGATTNTFASTAPLFFSPSDGIVVAGQGSPARSWSGYHSHCRWTIGVARDVSVVPTAPFPIG